ncbi:MAG: DUF4810 domain-containing protein [Bacteroidales bacterium]|jgi:hypothetical protein|nr:DUF4810 domain-containing protein [Bacteroidales bacterium]
MKKNTPVILIFLSTLLCSCAPKALYSFYDYDNMSYKFLKNQDDKTIEDFMKCYQQIINKQKGARNIVPPGVYADYGFFLYQKGENKEAIEMLNKEISFYPESKPFIGRIIKMIKDEK